jgi:hypothetical protein
MELHALLWPIMVQGFEGWPTEGSTAAPGHLSQVWRRMGTLAANTPARGCQGHSDPCLSHDGHPIHGIPRRKAVSPRDQSDSPENYMNWTSGIWSASPA